MNIRKCVVCSVEINGQKTKYCSNTCKQKHHWHRVKEQTNTYHSQTIRAYRRKLEMLELKGGCCSKCGYDKNLAALQFHHLNPSEKKIKLDLRSMGNNKVTTLLSELEKCIILCANCHLEEHNEDYTKEKIQQIIKDDFERKSILKQ
jgi:5-methylcytosine-specific restriction endonuclease McrA